MKKGNWEKIERWFRYWIVHRTFGGSVRLKDVPRINIERCEYKPKIKRCPPRTRTSTKGKCGKRR